MRGGMCLRHVSEEKGDDVKGTGNCQLRVSNS